MADEMISLGAKLKAFAQSQPDAPAVSCGDVTLSYSQFHRLTNRAARGLLAYGVKHGDLVTLGLPNSTDFAVACWAMWKIGATPQPVAFRLPQAELEAIMELAKTPVVIAEFEAKI
ncbi:MAG TPA: class I adenylate-forming enzyme family protein, partial [Phenylobacterium sp.]|nr:class I adenylate-forming enzyme family protein [Phenylobacterium sp.]